MGFSIAILFPSLPYFVNMLKKSQPSCNSLHRPPSESHLTPLLASLVHGGCAITRSHFWECNTSLMSLLICHSGCPPEQSSKSQEKALAPRDLNALHTS